LELYFGYLDMRNADSAHEGYSDLDIIVIFSFVLYLLPAPTDQGRMDSSPATVRGPDDYEDLGGSRRRGLGPQSRFMYALFHGMGIGTLATGRTVASSVRTVEEVYTHVICQRTVGAVAVMT